MDGDKVEKMGETARKNLEPIPEELDIPGEVDDSDDSDTEDDSRLSMRAQFEMDSLSQELQDYSG